MFMKTITLTAWLLMLVMNMAYADEPGDTAQPARWHSWQRAWQCNDIHVTETGLEPGVVHYDLGGTIWGGSQFVLNLNNGALFFNGRPCVPLG